MEDVEAHLKASTWGLQARLKVEALLSNEEKSRSLQQAGQGKFKIDHLESSKLHIWLADFTLEIKSKNLAAFRLKVLSQDIPQPPTQTVETYSREWTLSSARRTTGKIPKDQSSSPY